VSILEKVWLPFQLPQSDEDVTPGGHASNHGNERLIATASIGNHNIKLEQARFNDSSEYPVIRTESHIGLNLVYIFALYVRPFAHSTKGWSIFRVFESKAGSLKIRSCQVA